MSASDLPTIECTVYFLPESEGGRHYAFPNGSLSGGRYRPHLVVGDPQQRQSVIIGKNFLQEEYLGVAFQQGPEVIEFGKSLSVQLILIHYPSIQYEKLILGATFTIREGSHIVGYGTVVQKQQVNTS